MFLRVITITWIALRRVETLVILIVYAIRITKKSQYIESVFIAIIINILISNFLPFQEFPGFQGFGFY